MFLRFVPLAEPKDMLGCGINLTQWALLDLGGLTVLHCCLYPCVEVPGGFSSPRDRYASPSLQ